jgi:CDP-6-deoxy-D-xylo-4-hexulose-3-dehydrase
MSNINNSKEKIKENLKGLIKEYFSLEKKLFVPGKSKIPLSVPSYNWEEAYEALESILSTWVTMGGKVYKFESMFAEYLGVKNGVMVNSGSSANLIALSVLANPATNNRILKGSEIITPAVTWSTTIFPISNINSIPILTDINPETYTIDTEEIEKGITKKTRAILPVHLLGNPCDMDRITEIAQDHDLFILEDCCEAHGAEWKGQKVGSIGDLSSFSFFFSHHISTIEGGILISNNEDYLELAKSLRAHGWIRELKDRKSISDKYPKFDDRFLFINAGYNVRPTEIQGAFGIHQLKKLEKFIEVRRRNARYWTKKLEIYSDYITIPKEQKGTKHAWFGYPLTIKSEAPFNRKQLTDFLETRGIETRPIMAGNIAEQPVINQIQHRKSGNLEISRMVMRNSFFFGNHHFIRKSEREYIYESIGEFMGNIMKK